MDIVTILLLMLLGIGLAYCIGRLNRPAIETHDLAKKLVRERLRNSEALGCVDVLDACKIAHADRKKAARVLVALSEAVGMPRWNVPSNIPLADLLRIDRSELGEPKQLHIATTEDIDPFAYDIIETLLPITDQELWRGRWRLDATLPNDEEELITYIMRMTTCELLAFLVPLVRDESDDL